MPMEIKRFNPKYDEGLTNEQVNQRIAENLTNINEQPQTKTIKQIIYSNVFTYFNFLNIFLCAAIIITGLIYNRFLYSLKNCLFMGTIICNTIISTFQEITSKKIIDKLSFLASTKTTVIRNSRKKLISNEEIVLDDIIYLEIGNEVPTDCIVLNGKVEVNESLLTGEVDPIYKDTSAELLSGSFIVSGSCYAKVNKVGKDCYIAKISKEAKYNKKANSIIMGSFNQLLKILSILIIPIGILFFANQIVITSSIYDSVIATVAALIGMIPEGLILLTSSVMAVSIIRLSKYKVLVQQLYCIETLARVNVICLDKTGTITEGKMKVYDTIIEKGHNKKEIDKILGEICASAVDHSATFTALKDSFTLNQTSWKVKETIPFSSERKFSAVSFENENAYYLGAPDFILKDEYKNEKSKIENYQKKYRVLLLAKSNEKVTEHPKQLEKLAYILIKDVVRKDAKDTLEFFEREKVEVKVISGDNYNTVMSIAEEAGIKNIKGIDATTLNDETIKEAALNYNIFGRVTPKQKKQKKMGERSSPGLLQCGEKREEHRFELGMEFAARAPEIVHKESDGVLRLIGGEIAGVALHFAHAARFHANLAGKGSSAHEAFHRAIDAEAREKRGKIDIANRSRLGEGEHFGEKLRAHLVVARESAAIFHPERSNIKSGILPEAIHRLDSLGGIVRAAEMMPHGHEERLCEHVVAAVEERAHNLGERHRLVGEKKGGIVGVIES